MITKFFDRNSNTLKYWVEDKSFRFRNKPIRDEVSMHLFSNSTQIQARPDSKRFFILLNHSNQRSVDLDTDMGRTCVSTDLRFQFNFEINVMMCPAGAGITDKVVLFSENNLYYILATVVKWWQNTYRDHPENENRTNDSLDTRKVELKFKLMSCNWYDMITFIK